MSRSALVSGASPRLRRRWSTVGLLVVTILGLLAPAASLAAGPPSSRRFVSVSQTQADVTTLAAPAAGFTESVAFSGLVNPTVVQFASDGRVFVAEKSGIIKVFDSLTDTTPTVFADLRTNVYSNWDRGLLGMVLAPSFPTDPSVYVLYAYDHILGESAAAPRWGAVGAVTDGCPTPPGINSAGCVISGRLSKLTAVGNVSNGTEQVLIEDWCQQFPSHSVGSLAFGSDGALYVSGGDGASFNAIDYGQEGGPYYPGGNPCNDPGPHAPGQVLTPPGAEGGALRSQDILTQSAPPSGSSYSSTVLASGPVGYWRLGDTGAQAVDAGPNALHGSYVGAPTRGVPGALAGDANTAVDFPALSAAVTVPDNALLDLGDGPFSYELWFALDEDLGSVDQMLLNRGTGAPNIALDGATRRLQLTKGGFGGLFTGSTVIPINSAWHHLVITRSAAGAGNSQIYLDGVAETITNESPATTYANNSEVLTFGRKNLGPVERWGGKLDEISIYRRVLSASEVTSHYNAGITGTGGGGSADPTSLDGAILRVSPSTGLALPTNPNAGSPDPNARRIIAHGLRNPFRFTIRPGTSEVWLGDVGWNNWEEINRIPSPTDAVVENFGWPCYEGVGRMASYDAANLSICENLYAAGSGAVAAPLFTYSHSSLVVPGETCPSGTSAIAGMAFYPETGGSFPASFRGALFFADYSRNCIWVMFKGSNGLPDPATRQTFVAGAAGPVDLKVGPGGDLFYVDLGGGTVRRIRSTTTGQAPTAVIQATPSSGAAPLAVSFDGTGSSDPESGPLTYAWDFTTNGSIDSTSPSPTFTYTQPGDFTATLTVTDNQSLSGSTTRLIHVTSASNAPPVPTIITPTSSTTWAVGERIDFSGSAVDPEDGNLPDANLSWSVVLMHCPPTCHPHPGDTFNGVASGHFDAPNHDYPSHLELTLTATDSQGLSASKTVSLEPRTVDITMASAPAGLELTFAGLTQSAPFTVTAIEGSTTTIIARTPQSLSGTNYVFSSWSDGGAQTHSITLGTADATFTATFSPVTGPSYSAAVLASGPTGYWRLGDTGAQAVDTGPNALHGSYLGSPTRGVPGALVGDSNTAVDFPALTAAVTVPDNALLDLGDGPFSYELWFALDETLGTTDQMLLNRGTNAPNVALDGATKRLMLTKGGFGPLFMGSSVIAANSTWHHLVVTRSAAGAGNTKIYLDGVAQTVTAVSPATTYANNSEVLTFGRKNVGPVERWGGKLDEIAIYRRVLSASEVTGHYNAGIAP